MSPLASNVSNLFSLVSDLFSLWPEARPICLGSEARGSQLTLGGVLAGLAFAARGVSKNLVAVAIPVTVTIFLTDVYAGWMA